MKPANWDAMSQGDKANHMRGEMLQWLQFYRVHIEEVLISGVLQTGVLNDALLNAFTLGAMHGAGFDLPECDRLLNMVNTVLDAQQNHPKN